MFISFNLYVNNIHKDLIADDAVLHYFRLVDKNENNSIKLDIHNTHKYLNGFLDVALGLSPESEYSTAKPNYLYTQHTLEEFIEILCNLIYISNSSSNGEINSMLTAHKLYIELDSAFELQIKETGEGLRQ